jgi:hypothetical protein
VTVTTSGLAGKSTAGEIKAMASRRMTLSAMGSAITRGFVGDPETIEMGTERITIESRLVGSWRFPTTNNLTDGCLRFSTKRRKLCHKTRARISENLHLSAFLRQLPQQYGERVASFSDLLQDLRQIGQLVVLSS